MDKILVPNFSLLDHSKGGVCTSVLDNWMYQADTKSAIRVIPKVIIQEVEKNSNLAFNINEDDQDCPGHERRLHHSSSTDTLCYSSEEDGETRARAMSVDVSDDALDHSNNNSEDGIYFMIDTQTVENRDSRPKVGSSRETHLRPGFFRLERRASYDNGIFGLPDRIIKGEVGTKVAQRSAKTAPGTPAEPGTPVGRYLSDDEFPADPEKVFKRIYNLLCAERVTQMTKTYNDIEAVTRLLEEKERDLELAARIGQTLLSKNKELSNRTDILEEQLLHANDKVNQLKHDLSLKDELLKFYCQDLQDESSGNSTPGDTPLLSKLNLDLLHRKVSTLEEENIHLRLESAQLRQDTESYEEKEKKLVEDCLQQLTEVNQQVEIFAGELRLKTEESARQKEEITSLLAQVADLHKRVRQLTIENMDLTEKLQASQESQKQLTKDLSRQQDRYDELFEMLEEAQDELRVHRNRNNPRATHHYYPSAAVAQATNANDSLASELQYSLQQDDEVKEQRKVQNWKIFETARAAKKAASKSSRESSVRMSTSASSSMQDPNSLNPSNVPSNAPSDNESFHSDGYNGDLDSLYGSNPELGRPGIPGSNDLESALRRLALRRANELNEQDFQEDQKRLYLERETRSEGMSPFTGSRTPESTASMSSISSYLGYNNYPVSQYKLSDKLQIIKPLEGSLTLRQWQRLAQPHLGGLFERRDGVKNRGERKLDLEGEVYTLSDFEEDDEEPECPSRRMADSSTVYTFTNSMVSCPSDRTLSHSFSTSSLQSMGPSGYSTPRSDSTKGRAGTSSTYTMSLGLAAILEGREGAASRSLMRSISSCPSIPPVSSSNATPVTTEQSSFETTTSNMLSATNGPGLLGRLMSSGYSLLWNTTEATSSTSASISPATSVPAHSTKSKGKSGNSPVLPKGSTGVLSAITSFRKNGMF